MSVVPARPAVAVPPWTLLWLLLFVGALPGLVEVRWAAYVDLTAGGSYGPELAATASFTTLRLLAALGFVPVLVVVAGVIAVGVPPLRALVVERALRLSTPRRPVLEEIERFLREQGTPLDVRANLARQDRLARVYGGGWRQARLAVFGPLVVLWRRDRAVAEAILLHEVAHVRTGDHLVLGLGSPFIALLRLWLLVGVASVPLGVVIVLTGPAGVELTAQVLLLVGSVPNLILLPVGALWAAELAADRYVVDLGRRDALLRALDTQTVRIGWGRRAAALLSHPPVGLRRRAVVGGSAWQVAVLAAWPLLVLAQLGVILAAAVPAWLLIGNPPAELLGLVAANSGAYLVDALDVWGPAILLLVGWPVLTRPWTRFWVGTAVGPPTSGTPTYVAAALTAAAVLGVVLLVVRVVMAS